MEPDNKSVSSDIDEQIREWQASIARGDADALLRNPPGSPKISFEQLLNHPMTKGWVKAKSKDGRWHVAATGEGGSLVWLEDEQVYMAMEALGMITGD